MKYTVSRSVIQVIGTIWMPAATCAMDIELTGHDVSNIEEPITRETVEDWLNCHSGDFQSIEDFRADLEIEGETVVFDWKSDDSEITYNDCMFGSED